MVTFYKSHKIEVNAQPNGQILFDVYDRRGQGLLSGHAFSSNEQLWAETMKSRVDQLVNERPVDFRYS